MKNFIPTASYKVIYVYAISDEAHHGLLKIGESTLTTSKLYTELPADCSELNKSARKRIDSETITAGVGYHLLHTDLAMTVREEGGVKIPIPLGNASDKRVHKVLKASGIPMICPNGVAAQEWFKTDLNTVKNAIKAVKEGRPSLQASQISNSEIIVFREEQEDAIKQTIQRFMKHDTMLWNAKMRYGKTLTSLEMARRMQFRRIIIVTHKPVVGSGWQEDFYKIFKDFDGHYSFLFKENSSNEDDYDESIDSNNDKQLKTLDEAGESFVYFASIQDLRGSKKVGGKFDKNNIVFDMHWDLVINDEAHEGTQTDLGKKVMELLVKKEAPSTKVLSLSGTPFNIINQYDEAGIYTWDYVMEQERKANWSKLHPYEPNPYADLPQMHIYTYDLGKLINGFMEEDLAGKAFNFREFFRTWTGDKMRDGRAMPKKVKTGDFVHPNDVKSFLNLLVKPDGENNFPFSTEEYKDMFRHTLWLVPGVKEAAALSSLLQADDSPFAGFAVANVAGDGDEEKPYTDALKLVKDTIRKHDYSITISCGKLTTGVTVKEWTAVFILTGSQTIAAANYLQTIFRAQSPGVINGKRKEHCYVFDFAPDRSLKVFAEAAGASGGKRGGDTQQKLKLFLNYCPVISYDGSEMREYNVQGMMAQIKRLQVEHAIRSGFDDTSIYDNNELLKLGAVDIKAFNNLKKLVGSMKSQTKGEFDLTSSGLGQEKSPTDGTSTARTGGRSPEEIQAQKDRRTAISILRAISIRLPLLIYGADVPFDKDIMIDDFVDFVDQESWDEFMPKGVSKALFKKFTKYYDSDVFVEAGRKIRSLTLAADKLDPTERVQKIVEIFSFFRNPDKETVLTPWRVVNMHLGHTIGGYNFYDEDYNCPQEDPKKNICNDISEVVFGKNSRVLELNSKSGLYPLYIAYSIYRSRYEALLEELGELPLENKLRLWDRTLKENLYVICKTPMAEYITRRTLRGYRDSDTNVSYIQDLVEKIKTPEGQVKVWRQLKGNHNFWNNNINDMKFDAIVGNPPYQIMDGGAGASSIPVYNRFVELAKTIAPNYISIIMPSRWMTGGRGLDDFRADMLGDTRIEKLYDYYDATKCFGSVEIKGGICYFLWNRKHNGKCEINTVDFKNIKTRSVRFLKEDDCDIFIRDYNLTKIKNIVCSKSGFVSFSTIVSSMKPYGLRGDFFKDPSKYDLPEIKSTKEPGDYSIIGLDETLHRVIKYVPADYPFPQTDLLKSIKIFATRNYGSGKISDAPSGLVFAEPGEACTETFVQIGPFENQEQAHNCAAYMKTKFFRVLVGIRKQDQGAGRAVYQYAPIVDFSQKWTDEKLYDLFGIGDKDREYIESLISE